jgi:hypothetical protein
MKSITVQPTAIQATSAAHAFLMYPPLEQVTRPTVPTDQAAYYLNRRPQTMRSWASLQNGPIRPIRVNGRLAWRVVDIRAVLSGGRHGE